MITNTVIDKKVALIEAIEQMDTLRLKELLTSSGRYSETSIDILCENLEELFISFHENGDTALVAQPIDPAFSCSCYGDYENGVLFFGNYSDSYIHFYFECDVYGEYAIGHCHSSDKKTESSGKQSLYFLLTYDMIPGFYPDKNFQKLYIERQNGLAELRSHKDSGVDSAIMKKWTEKYEHTFNLVNTPEKFILRAFNAFILQYRQFIDLITLLDLKAETTQALAELPQGKNYMDIEILQWLVKYEYIHKNMQVLEVDFENYETPRALIIPRHRDVHINNTEFKPFIDIQNKYYQYYWKVLGHKDYSGLNDDCIKLVDKLLEESRKLEVAEDSKLSYSDTIKGNTIFHSNDKLS